MKKSALLFLGLVLLTGCATRYHAENFVGTGYSNFQVSDDSFVITFKGNGCTKEQDVMRYSLMRAADLCLQHGYEYFVVLDSKECTTTSLVTHESVSKDNKYQVAHGSVETIVCPGLTISVKCFLEDPCGVDVISAKQYISYNPLPEKR